MLSFGELYKILNTNALEENLSFITNQDTQDKFLVFSGTWLGFKAVKEQIIYYLNCHSDINSIWKSIDDDTEVLEKSMPFALNWVGLFEDRHYEIEVQGQQSVRIEKKWTGILSKALGASVKLYWVGGDDD